MRIPTLIHCICDITIRRNNYSCKHNNIICSVHVLYISSIFLCCQRYRHMRQQPVDTVCPLLFVYHMQALTAWTTLKPVDMCIYVCLIIYVQWKDTTAVLTPSWASTGQPWSSRSFILGRSPLIAASRNACSSPCTGDTMMLEIPRERQYMHNMQCTELYGTYIS